MYTLLDIESIFHVCVYPSFHMDSGNIPLNRKVLCSVSVLQRINIYLLVHIHPFLHTHLTHCYPSCRACLGKGYISCICITLYSITMYYMLSCDVCNTSFHMDRRNVPHPEHVTISYVFIYILSNTVNTLLQLCVHTIY